MNPSSTLLPGDQQTQYNATETAKQRVDRHLQNQGSGPKSRVLGLTLMVLVPWGFFAGVSMLFSFAYHWYPGLTGLLTGALAFVAMLLVMVDYRNKAVGGRWYMKLGLLSFASLLLGIFASLYTYHYYFGNYWSYKENAEYINVLPSEAASAHADAGKILFTVDTKVATEKTLGYRIKDMYCVAPIMDYATTTIQYWAVGTNCCHARSNFACDDVWNPRARSAVVVLDNRGFFPSVHSIYKKAAEQACAEWGLVQAKDPLFVHWVADATGEQNGYWSAGLGYLITFIAVYAVWSLLVGGIVQMSARKASAAATAGQGDGKGVRLPPAL
ncbi:unnamed protein product [Amoebophrya sp. A25]|nr:unnamed protein product [Amoebophrya sp. A25]|eukprot:GSA25T00018297001.1